MKQKDFNKNLDKYLSGVRAKEKPAFDFSEFAVKFKLDVNNLGLPKFKKTKEREVEYVDMEKSTIVKKEPFSFKLKKLFARKEKVAEAIEVESEEEVVEMGVKDEEEIQELEEGIAEIEEIEQEEKQMLKNLKRMVNKLKFLKTLKKRDDEGLEQEMEIAEMKQQEEVQDIKKIIDFSIELLKRLPKKDFDFIKNTASFGEYKRILKKHMKPKIEEVSEPVVEE